MITTETVSLSSLLTLAVGAGILHTLAGPDHYLPIVAVGKARSWTLRRVVTVTALLGLAHCLVSALLVLGLLTVFAAVVPTWIDAMGTLAACLLIATGAVLCVGAWRGKIRRSRPALTLLAAAFLVGPCEWLIPVGLAAGSAHGLFGAILVSGAFTLATVTTMITATALGTVGLPEFVRPTVANAFAGSICALCGGLMLAGF